MLSNPVDSVRVRQSLHGGSSNGIRVGFDMLRTGGLQAGLAPAMGYNVVMNATRFSLFRLLSSDDGAALGPTVSASMAGGMSGLVASPLARLRTLLQAGHAESVARQVLQHQPWAGASMLAVRNGGYTAIIFPLYEWIERRIERHFETHAAGPMCARWPTPLECAGPCQAIADCPLPNLDCGCLPAFPPSINSERSSSCVSSRILRRPSLQHLASSLTAAFVACFAMNPLDVHCTRLFNQGTPSKQGAQPLVAPPPCGPLESSLRTAYRGLGANLVRTVPHTVLTFVFAEALRQRSVDMRTLAPSGLRSAWTLGERGDMVRTTSNLVPLDGFSV